MKIKRLSIGIGIFALVVIVFGMPYFPQSLCPGENMASLIQMVKPIAFFLFALTFTTWVALKVLRRLKFNAVLKVLSGSVAIIVLSFILMALLIRASDSIRKLALNRIMDRGELLISAIDQFQSKNGRWPHSLDELKISIPSTNVCGFQKFKYEVSKQEMNELNDISERMRKGESAFLADEVSQSGGYELFVEMPLGMLNWDVFVYWPSKKYPSLMKGGSVQRFRDWAYVHE